MLSATFKAAIISVDGESNAKETASWNPGGNPIIF
jgi:hypothetical protein